MLDAHSALQEKPALQDQPALFEESEPASLKDAEIAVNEPEPALPWRSDTMLGVCEALGQDFGFNANYLRIALASLVLWDLYAAIGIYLGLGVVVAVSRWIAPAPLPATEPKLAADPESPAVSANANTEALAVAA
jgi:phage shock protein PspC (stress-responsive transcriptional regulator)